MSDLSKSFQAQQTSPLSFLQCSDYEMCAQGQDSIWYRDWGASQLPVVPLDQNQPGSAPVMRKHGA